MKGSTKKNEQKRTNRWKMIDLRYVKVEAWLNKERIRPSIWKLQVCRWRLDALMIRWRLREKVIGSLTTRSCRSEKENPSIMGAEHCFQQSETGIWNKNQARASRDDAATFASCTIKKTSRGHATPVTAFKGSVGTFYIQSQSSIWIRNRLERGISLNSVVWRAYVVAPQESPWPTRNTKFGSVIPSIRKHEFCATTTSLDNDINDNSDEG